VSLLASARESGRLRVLDLHTRLYLVFCVSFRVLFGLSSAGVSFALLVLARLCIYTLASCMLTRFFFETVAALVYLCWKSC